MGRAIHLIANGEPAWAGAVLKVPRRWMGRLRGFGSSGAALFLWPAPNPGASMKNDYKVGYKKPPKDHQFKSKHLRDEPQGVRRQRKENGLDLAGIFEKPLRVKRGGKTISMHPYEAELTSLGKRALKGQPRATKLFLKHCEAAGLLDPSPAEQTHGVFVIPKGVNGAIAKVLIETYGLPPWDADAYAALEAEYQRDQANIEKLYQEFMKDHENG